MYKIALIKLNRLRIIYINLIFIEIVKEVSLESN